MGAIQKHIEEILGGFFGTGTGLMAMASQDFFITVLTAFVSGCAGALGGYFIKRITTRKKKG
jgi:hypothetical protein